jgi:hypothetical protein
LTLYVLRVLCLLNHPWKFVGGILTHSVYCFCRKSEIFVSGEWMKYVQANHLIILTQLPNPSNLWWYTYQYLPLGHMLLRMIAYPHTRISLRPGCNGWLLKFSLRVGYGSFFVFRCTLDTDKFDISRMHDLMYWLTFVVRSCVSKVKKKKIKTRSKPTSRENLNS